MAREMEVTGINQLWEADITYIQLPKDFIYLAVIIDVGSRRCIGWDLDRTIDTQLTLNALHKALECRAGQNLDGLVHHSDQGVQYASNAYIECVMVSWMYNTSKNAKTVFIHISAVMLDGHWSLRVHGQIGHYIFREIFTMFNVCEEIRSVKE
jgi:transposase InsO family protein